MTTVLIQTNADQVAAHFAQHSQEFRSILNYAGQEVADGLLRDFRQTTRTWTRQPEFVAEVDVAGTVVGTAKGTRRDINTGRFSNAAVGGQIVVLVGTDDPTYKLVDEGSRPHFIFPVNKRALRFRVNYRAKTQPGILDSFRGGASGPWVVRAWVLHPGVTARRFGVLVRDKWQKEAPKICERLLTRYARQF